jgi:hypothetical protein
MLDILREAVKMHERLLEQARSNLKEAEDELQRAKDTLEYFKRLVK